MAYHRKWKRRPQHPHNPPHGWGGVRDGERYTIMMSTPPIPDSLPRHETIPTGADTRQIATRVDVIGCLLRAGTGGGPLTDGDRRNAVREEILRMIHSIIAQLA
jgi:hypothetical protein